ncbi:MAG TPA: glycogen/starch synthase [Bacteroidales bacterium]|nr:glycogen/starch synthase [Bacteroidales bacterium]
MNKTKVLYVMQEITPYLKENPISHIGRHLPQGIQERGREIRTFMPRYGKINERRNQLHEVIRLSGMNLIIEDADHPLIIKVASIQQARMQVYFIDNEDYFHRKALYRDKNGVFFEDNDERMIFYARGVLETVKKLGWPPDIIHCHGWFSSLLPLYIKTAFKDNPLFSDSKVVFSIYNDVFDETLNSDLLKKLKYDKIKDSELKSYKKATYEGIIKGALDYSDAVIVGSDSLEPVFESYIQQLDKPILNFQNGDTFIEAYNDFYNELLKEVN